MARPIRRKRQGTDVMSIGMDFRRRAEYWAFRIAVGILQALSLRTTVRCARGFGWLMTRGLPRKLTRYGVAADNLRRAFGPQLPQPEIDRLIRGMWEHLFRLVVETVQLPRKIHLTNCREIIVFRERKRVVSALCSDRPVVVLGGHFGNWEISMATFGLFGFPMGVVAREMDNPYLHRWFERSRTQFGHRLLLKEGGWGGMLSSLRAAGNLGILCDQDAGRRGLFVDFFGAPASTFKSIALMALEYRALLVVGYGLRLPDDWENARWARFEIGCEDVIDPLEFTGADAVREITQRFTSALERAIRRAPEQYFWVHRRWKTDPVTRKKTVKQQSRRVA